MYSVGQVSKMFGLPVSTLRYYDKQGLFPGLQRVSGIRQFSDRELEALRVIECLKRSGLSIDSIRQFMEWCTEGPQTYPQRKALFERQKKTVEAEIDHMEQVLSLLRFKCWYYEQALKDGGEEKIRAMIPQGLPDDVRAAYEKSLAPRR